MNREEFINAKRIVFKFGTNILRGDDGYASLPRVFSFIEDHHLRKFLPFLFRITKIHRIQDYVDRG